MKKSIFGIAFLFATIAGFSAMAQTDTTAQAPTTEQTGCCQRQCPMKDGRKGEGKKGMKQGKQADCMARFADLNLTDQQKEKIQALNVKCKAERDAARKECAEARKQAYSQNGDANGTPDKAACKKARRQKRIEARKNYLASLSEILTPEQYTQFLENNFTKANRPEKAMKQGKGKRGEGCKAGKGKKGKGRKGQCNKAPQGTCTQGRPSTNG